MKLKKLLPPVIALAMVVCGTMANPEPVSAVTVKTVTANQQAIDAAVEWGIKHANDNTFHYGETKWAHHNGCYYCGTNQNPKSVKRKSGGPLDRVEKSYCCNPFATAMFVHGAGAKEMDCKVNNKRFGLANDRNKICDSAAFTKVPKDKTKLQKGDVLMTPTHLMVYIGDGQIVHAAGHDNGVRNSDSWNRSIRVNKLPDRQWKRVSKIYRYVGKGRFEDKRIVDSADMQSRLVKAIHAVAKKMNTAKVFATPLIGK